MGGVGSPGTGPSAASTALAVTDRRVVRSEWRKFRTLRSNLVTVVVGAALSIAFGVLIVGVGDPADLTENGQVVGETALNGLSGILPLVFAVLGVLSATNEYASGLARVTFAAVPRRGQVVRAKAAVLAGVAAVTVAAGGAIAFALGAARYDDTVPYGSLVDSGVLTTIGTSAVRTAAFAALGLAIGFLVRSGAGGIATVFGFLLAAPGVIGMIPTVGDAASDYLPMAAADAMTNRTGRSDLAPALGAAVLLAWVSAGLVAAVVITRRRDA